MHPPKKRRRPPRPELFCSSPDTPVFDALISAWAGREEQVALSGSSADPAVTAADLASAVAALARTLTAATAGAVGRTVGLDLPPGPAWVASALACWAAGCAWAPTAGAARSTPPPHLAAVVVAGHGAGPPPSPGATAVALPPGFPCAVAGGEQEGWAPSPPPDPCYALPTSGSASATARVVRGTWAGVCARAAWAADALGLGPGDTVACLTPPTFVDSVSASLIPLLLGAAVVVVSNPADAAAATAALASATVATATPATWSGVLAHANSAGDASWSRRLRLLISSGAPLPVGLARNLDAALPRAATCLNLYGLTEAAGDSTAADVRAWLEERDDAGASIAPAGTPIAGADVWVTAAGDGGGAAHPATLPPLLPGAEGLVVIAGPGVAAGYERGAESSGDDGVHTTRFVTLPCGRRAVLTGDRGVVQPTSGALVVLGRADRVVRAAGGARVDVDADAVEAAAASACPGVAAAAAVLLPGSRALALGVVPAPHAGCTVRSVRAWAAAALPPSSQPAAIVLFPGGLPLLASGGKVDRRTVAAACAEQARHTAAPSPGEAAVASAMAATLQARRAAGGAPALPPLEATSDFALLGGDSMDAAALASALGPPATVAVILAARTPRGIARALAAGGAVVAHATTTTAAAGLPPLLTFPSPRPPAGFRVRWRVPLDGCVDAPPLVAEGGAAVLATSHGGEAVCVEAGTGAVRWRARLPGAADEGAAVSGGGGVATIALAGFGLAFLNLQTGAPSHPPLPLGGSPRGPPAGAWVGLREGEALRVERGGRVTARVRTPCRALAGAPVPCGAAWFGAGTAGERGTLIRGEGGRARAWPPAAPPVWSGAPFAAPPLIVAGHLVVAADTAGTVAAFDAGSGALAWRAALGGPVVAPPAVSGSALIFPVRAAAPALVAVDAGAGATLWTASLPGDVAGTGAASTPAVLGGGGASRRAPRLVAAAADGGVLAVLDARTGALLSAARLPAAVYGGPVAVTPSLIVCGCRDDAAWAVEIV